MRCIKFFSRFTFIFFGLVLLGVGCGTGEVDSDLVNQRPYKEIVDPSGFVNSDPFLLQDLVGKKVILLDIMTYSCINCQRTFPYINAWHEAYEDEGLAVVGIHTPEFGFEKKIENVRDAAERFGLKFPIVLDNDYGTWNAYENRFWPRKFLIDINGNIAYDHIGEGGYDETELKIQELLEERKRVLSSNVALTKEMQDVDAEVVAPSRLRSPETYFGSLRAQFLGHAVSQEGTMIEFAEPVEQQKNSVYLVGVWDVQPEYAEAVSEDAYILYNYTAQKVFLVMSAQDGVDAWAYQDGEAVGSGAGEHVEDGLLRVEEEQLYRIIENEEVETHEFRLDVQPGLRAFAFTFG